MKPREAFGNAFGEYLEDARLCKPVSLSANSAGSHRYSRNFAEAKESEIAPFYKMQSVIRPMFGKFGYCDPAIGDHPDFLHLKGSDDRVFCPITTLFMDIEGSTRLGLLYPIEDVVRIKNAFIRAAIEVIAAFDGHVHRIMGDAVMAYFGGKTVRPGAAIVDGLNCAALLRALAERVVVPKLADLGFDHAFGIRIGLDYGPPDKVLWSSYGYPRSDEVTATSFFVDVASKLQHAASRNEIMVGNSLTTFLDLHDDFLAIKRVLQRGEAVEDLYVTPNHTGLDGQPINYRQHIFLGDEYLKYGPLGYHDRKLIGADGSDDRAAIIPVSVEICSERKGPRECVCPPCSAPIPKEKWLRFTTRLPYLPRLPYTIRCNVENHGEESLRLGGPDRGNHDETHSITTLTQHERFEHWETTRYHGLHYLTVDVRAPGGNFKRTVAVFVE
jgi:class 3 adenylate cyclase